MAGNQNPNLNSKWQLLVLLLEQDSKASFLILFSQEGSVTTFMKCIHKVSKKERNMEKKKKGRKFSLNFLPSLQGG